MKNNSVIISAVSRILIPFVLVFGIYIVIGGADSVGGGFQGGAVLSAVFMLRYLVNPSQEENIKLLSRIEKIFMIMLLLLVGYILAVSMEMGEVLGELWMIVLNFIIAIKVCCGLGIIFFRYVLYEGK